MKTKKIILSNPSGLHARPASKFCAIAKKHQSKVLLITDDNQTIDADRILDVMAANFKYGDCLEIQCSGSDEENTLKSLCDFIESLTE